MDIKGLVFTCMASQDIYSLLCQLREPRSQEHPSSNGTRISLVAQTIKNPLAMQETRVRSLDWEDPLEKGKAPHSSILA